MCSDQVTLKQGMQYFFFFFFLGGGDKLDISES